VAPTAPLVAALPVGSLEAAPATAPLSARVPLMGSSEVAAAMVLQVGQVWVSSVGDLPAPLVGSLVFLLLPIPLVL